MAKAHKRKKPEYVYYIKLNRENAEPLYQGPFIGKRPIKEGEELIKYKLLEEN